MKSATSLLNIGHSGLMASKKRLATAGHNVANANTEGFSRQRAPQETTHPVSRGNLVLGTGTQVARVERIHDKYLESKLGLSITDHSFHKEKTFQLSQVENVFNEIDVAGFSSILNGFFNSFRELSRQPGNEALKTIVREKANQLARNFKKTKRDLNELQFSMDKKIAGAIENINLLLNQIRKLNTRIVSVENEGGITGDLRDQRDLKVRELAGYFSIKVYEDNQGQLVINADGIGSLVSGGHVLELIAQKSAESQAYLPGGVEIYFKSRPTYRISQQMSGGQLGALLSSRNNELKELQQGLDNLAFNLAHKINSIHRRGIIEKPPLSGFVQEKITGIDFFYISNNRYGAGETIDLSDKIKQDAGNIVTAEHPGERGDNRIAIAISKLQHENILDNGSSTFEEFYLKGVGKIGAKVKNAKVNQEHSLGILAQNKELRERVSGVSIDEETANMIRFQHAFDASARVMSVADEMFKTVLGIKKL